MNILLVFLGGIFGVIAGKLGWLLHDSFKKQWAKDAGLFLPLVILVCSILGLSLLGVF